MQARKSVTVGSHTCSHKDENLQNDSLFIISWAVIHPISLTKGGREKIGFGAPALTWDGAQHHAVAHEGVHPVTNAGGTLCFQSLPTRGSSTNTRPLYTRTIAALFRKRLGICTSQR